MPFRVYASCTHAYHLSCLVKKATEENLRVNDFATCIECTKKYIHMSWYDQKDEEEGECAKLKAQQMEANRDEADQMDRDEQKEQKMLRRKLLSRFDNNLNTETLIADDFDSAW